MIYYPGCEPVLLSPHGYPCSSFQYRKPADRWRLITPGFGPQDGYMPEKSARAYLRDLPNAELHVLSGGHWLLEAHLDEVATLIRQFLRY